MFILAVVLSANVGHAQTIVWAQSVGGEGNDVGNNIVVDSDGNSYVTGEYQGTATFGSFMLISAGDADIFVVKYDTSGAVLWAQSASTSLVASFNHQVTLMR